MKKVITTTIFIAVLLLSTISAEMILQQQPKELYNYGDVVDVPIKIKAMKDMQGTLSMNLICAGEEFEKFKEDIKISSGEEIARSPSIILSKSLIIRPTTCVIKATYLDEYLTSNEFTISNQITITLKEGKTSFKPGESFLIEGNAVKENGLPVEGFVEVQIRTDGVNESIELFDTTKKGYFYLNSTLAEDMKAGEYYLMVNVHEKEDNEISNQGLTNYQITIEQVPTSVEVYFENSQIIPGENVQVKAILHDQTGEKIDSTSIITIKNENNKIMFQEERATDEVVEFEIPSDYPISEWEVVAVSNRLTGTNSFEILENKAIETTIVNGTLLIQNKGNVPYNDSISVKIGNETIFINTSLGVGEEEKYNLEAPNGEYAVEVASGNYSFHTESVMLTGRAIDISKAGNIGYVLTHPFVWVFIVVILGAGAYLIFKRGYNKTFIAYLRKYRGDESKSKKLEKKPLKFLEITNIAKHSLSLTGEKHPFSMICLRVKELESLKNNFDVQKSASVEGTALNAIQKVINFAQSKNAYVNMNKDCITFIFSPLVTKTFKNEKEVLNTATSIEKMLRNYNKMARDKITFGVSINNGEIVANKKGDTLEFAMMGNLIAQSKKLSSIKDKGVILNENVANKLSKEIKTQKHKIDSLVFYTIKEFKNSEENEKFLKRFVSDLEKEEKDRQTKNSEEKKE